MSIHQPLRPWLWCCIWLLLIWSSLQLVDSVLSPYYRNSFNDNNNFNHPRDIYILGDSLAAYSFSEIDSVRLNGQKKSLARLLANGGSWRDFVHYVPMLEQNKPGLIIVQDSLFLQKDKQFFAISLFGYLKRKLLNNNAITRDLAKPSTSQMMLRKEILNKTYTNNKIVSQDAIEFVRDLSRMAKKIVVVHLPRSLFYENTQEQKQWHKHLKADLSDMDIPFYVMGEPLPEKLYFDGAHTNKKGAEVRQKQLKVFLEKYLP